MSSDLTVCTGHKMKAWFFKQFWFMLLPFVPLYVTTRNASLCRVKYYCQRTIINKVITEDYTD